MVFGDVGVKSPATRVAVGTGLRVVTPVADDSGRRLVLFEEGAAAEADRGVL